MLLTYTCRHTFCAQARYCLHNILLCSFVVVCVYFGFEKQRFSNNAIFSPWFGGGIWLLTHVEFGWLRPAIDFSRLYIFWFEGIVSNMRFDLKLKMQIRFYFLNIDPYSMSILGRAFCWSRLFLCIWRCGFKFALWFKTANQNPCSCLNINTYSLSKLGSAFM